ncbi:hypothetical protein ACQKMY_25615 [Peribacillus frigoritolerans]|uniref:hypothetical protein n=1 Tax=Peribacillus frigoritolerans TaxID=450367 RepID=UPI003CFD2534
MTLSQRIIKKWLLPFVLCFSMIFVIFPQSKADAGSNTSTFEFNTYSKSREHRITNVGRGANISFYTDSYWYRTHTSTWETQGGIQNDGALSVKLCRAGTSTCTTTKSFRYTAPTFTNMNGGDYDIYVYDNETYWYHHGDMLYEVWR